MEANGVSEPRTICGGKAGSLSRGARGEEARTGRRAVRAESLKGGAHAKVGAKGIVSRGHVASSGTKTRSGRGGGCGSGAATTGETFATLSGRAPTGTTGCAFGTCATRAEPPPHSSRTTAPRRATFLAALTTRRATGLAADFGALSVTARSRGASRGAALCAANGGVAASHGAPSAAPACAV